MERDERPQEMAKGPAAEADRLPVTSLPEEEVRRLLSEPSLLAQLADILTVMDEQIRFLYVSRTAGDRTMDDVIGKSVLAHIPPEYHGVFVEAFRDAWRTEQPRVVEASSNDALWWETRLVPLRGADGVKRMVATTVDITRRKHAERALRESERRLRESESRLRDALAISGVGIWSWNERDGSISWDDNLCAIFAVPPELVPTDIEAYYGFILLEDAQHVRAHSGSALETGVFEELEFRIVRPSGEVRHLVARGARTYDDAGQPTGLRGGMIDVTERKRLEERVRQAHKMEAVGQLTAGIAHNFNNLLGIILPNAALCHAQASPFVQGRLQDIEHAATRAADLVRQLMLFTRQEGASEKRPVSLSQITQRTVTICRATFDPRLELILHDSPGLPCVVGREGELEQVLLNVLLNARHAVLEAQVATPRVIVRLTQPSATKVRLTVDDNGPGVPADLRTRIFEPFFTTKEVGKGTGLGLATCYAVVQEHEGTIWAEQSPTSGTRIAIELPASALLEHSAH